MFSHILFSSLYVKANEHQENLQATFTNTTRNK